MNKFNLYGPVNNLGYGIFTRGIIKGLKQLGNVDYHLDIIGQPQLDGPGEEANLINHLIQKPWTRKAASVAIWHEFDLSKFSGEKLVAFPIFETTGFFPAATNYLAQMDAVMVASNWAKQVIHKNVGDSLPVFVVPGAANLTSSPAVTATSKYEGFTFLHVGKFENRKSTIETIRAYIAGFSNTTFQTRLLCHCFNPFDQSFQHNMAKVLQSLGLRLIQAATPSSLIAIKGNCIVEIPVGRVSDEQLSQLYRAAHVGVFASKGEGWNLPLMEAIQSGLPCIATNYSAHTEYLTSQFDYPQDLLLTNLKMEPAYDGLYFKGDRGDWAAPSIEELAHKMRYAYDNYHEIVAKFDPTKIAQTFTWTNSANKFLECLSSI
jgi:glycosyltransferase involved in cell wall biosynthesis